MVDITYSFPPQDCLVEGVPLRWMIMISAILLLVTTLYVATILQSYPLDQLGLRPNGRGLWSYLGHYFLQNIGIHGYDPIQGALSPPLRLLCHIGACMILWSVSLFLFPTTTETTTTSICGNIHSIFHTSLFSIVIYSTIMFILHHVLPAVSMPGGPRPHKIQRQPQWKNQHHPILDSMKSWNCLVADDSHDATHEKFQDSSTTVLTGEPAGRQTWWFQPTKDTKSTQSGAGGGGNFLMSLISPKSSSTSSNNNVDEELVQQLALGGRPSGFNPSQNPNSNDQLFRAQQIRKYLLQQQQQE